MCNRDRHGFSGGHHTHITPCVPVTVSLNGAEEVTQFVPIFDEWNDHFHFRDNHCGFEDDFDDDAVLFAPLFDNNHFHHHHHHHRRHRRCCN